MYMGQESGAADAPALRRAPGVLLKRLSTALDTLLDWGIARHDENDNDIIELFLNAEERSEGGMVAIPMYVAVHCPRCAGDRSPDCPRCQGKGTTDDLFTAWLAVRPGVSDGTMLKPSALLPGMVRPVTFRARVRA